MKTIGIIITTFMRDELLFKSVESILSYLQENQYIIIVDQGKSSKEKSEWLHGKRVFYYQVPFDSGLSYCRNFGVKIAKELNCDYVIIGSDSFLFNNTLSNINTLIENKLHNYDLIGFELSGCVCDWEAKLKLIEGQSFELDFIDKSQTSKNCSQQLFLYDCDIVRNFFIAKTDSLFDVKWDDKFKLGEHEDFFFRFRLTKHKVGWTDYITADKMTDRPNEYSDYRRINFNEGLKHLRKKYNISGWVTYKNLERAKRG